MPDIFGREQSDYSYLQDYREAGILDSHNQQLAARERVHNFDALPSPHAPVQVPLQDEEAAAQAIHFVTNNMQAIQAVVEEILYTDFRLDEYFPIVTNIPEGVRSYAYRVTNRYGKGKFIDNSGKDAGTASVSLQTVPYNIERGGIIPNWNDADLRSAAFTGIALDTKTIEAGTEGCLDHIEEVGLLGNSAYGFEGLINNSDIPASGSAKTIANMSPDEMVAFIQTNVAAIIAQTSEVMSRIIKGGLTIYLPLAQETLIGDTKLADDASKTVWEYVKVNNQWSRRTGTELKMQTVAELAGAGDGGSDRCLFGFNNERIMEMAMPIQPRIVRTIERHYGIDAPMEYQISGLNVKRATAMRYVDDI